MVCRNTIIITISLFIFVNYNLFAPTVIEGRVLLKLTDVNSTTKSFKIIKREDDDKISWIAEKRGREVMGSRPPRCLGRCAPCGGNCKAVQVPWMRVSNIDYARGDHSSDYKPITWKCQCGSSLFNP